MAGIGNLGFAFEHEPEVISVGGILGIALDASRNGRLKSFVKDENSRAIHIYDKAVAATGRSNHYDGEAAGKWLYAAAKCAKRSGDPELIKIVRAVSDFLISQQWDDGYIGTICERERFTGPIQSQTYDLWMNGFIMHGLLAVYRLFPDERYLSAVRRLADLIIDTFREGRKSIMNSGCWGGMAPASVIEHFVDLYTICKDEKYLAFAEYTLAELEKRPGTEILTRALLNYDAAQIGGNAESKVYEMLWCFIGIAKLYQATGRPILLQACKNHWEEVCKHHLNAAGGPCGGVGVHHEVYNLRFMFTPYFRSETCSTMAWIQFSREMLKITGEAKYAEQIERSAYNALLGAQFPDGQRWIYHSQLNGKREPTAEFACCSGSGPIALEELPAIIYSSRADGIAVNLFAASKASLRWGGETVAIEQITEYPHDGKIIIRIGSDHKRAVPILLRIPSWIGAAPVKLDGKSVQLEGDRYHAVSAQWKAGDTIEIEFPMPLRWVEQQMEYNEKGWFLDDQCAAFRAVYRGPLLYATEWKDLLEEPNPLTIPSGLDLSTMEYAPPGMKGPALAARHGDRGLVFVPYYEVNGRKDQTCHVAWLKVIGS